MDHCVFLNQTNQNKWKRSGPILRVFPNTGMVPDPPPPPTPTPTPTPPHPTHTHTHTHALSTMSCLVLDNFRHFQQKQMSEMIQIWSVIQNRALSDFMVYGPLNSYKKSEKKQISQPLLRKFADLLTDRHEDERFSVLQTSSFWEAGRFPVKQS